MRIESPFHTVDFLEESQEILKSRFTALTVDDCVDSAGTLLSATSLHDIVEFFLSDPLIYYKPFKAERD